MPEPSPPATARHGFHPASWALTALLLVLVGRYAVGFDPSLSSPSLEELRVHLSTKRAAWLATWMADGGFGRPLTQIGGPVFWPGNLLSWIVSEPGPWQASLAWSGVVAAWLAATGWLVGGGLSRGRAWSMGAVIALVPVFVSVFLGQGSIASLRIPAAEPWVLACGFLALDVLRRWFHGGDRATGPPAGLSAWSPGWNLVFLAFALHSLSLVGPLPVVRDAGLALLAATIYFGVASGHGRRIKGVAWAVLAAAFSVWPVYADLSNQRELPEIVGQPAAVLPLLVPAAAAEQIASHRFSLDLTHPDLAVGTFEVDRTRTDQLAWRLPKEDGERLLVLPIRFDPSWRPFFKGREIQIVCVNETYLGVLVTKKGWEVKISYVPLSPLVLLSQFAFAMLGILWALLWIFSRVRGTRPRL